MQIMTIKANMNYPTLDFKFGTEVKRDIAKPV